MPEHSEASFSQWGTIQIQLPLPFYLLSFQSGVLKFTGRGRGSRHNFFPNFRGKWGTSYTKNKDPNQNFSFAYVYKTGACILKGGGFIFRYFALGWGSGLPKVDRIFKCFQYKIGRSDAVKPNVIEISFTPLTLTTDVRT